MKFSPFRYTRLFKIIQPVWLHNQASSQNMQNCRLRRSSSRLARLADFLGPRWQNPLIRCTLSSDTCGRAVLLPVLEQPVSSNCRYHRRMPWAPDGSIPYRRQTQAALWLLIQPQKLQHTKCLLLYGRHFLTDCLSRSHSYVRPSRGDFLKPGDFLFHLVDAKLIHGWWVRNYAYLKSDKTFWIILYYSHVYCTRVCEFALHLVQWINNNIRVDPTFCQNTIHLTRIYS